MPLLPDIGTAWKGAGSGRDRVPDSFNFWPANALLGQLVRTCVSTWGIGLCPALANGATTIAAVRAQYVNTAISRVGSANLTAQSS